MIYNYTKCESVIAKIMADLDSTEVKQRTSDIREWIFEAVDKIGAPMQYISRELGSADDPPVMKIHDYQVPIPADLQILDGVAFSETPHGPWVPMSTMTSIFKDKRRPKPVSPQPYVELKHDPANLAIPEPAVIEHGEMPLPPPPHQPMMYKMPTSQHQLYTVNGIKYLHRQLTGLEKPEYFIKPGWIVTNKKHGFIKLAYKAIAVDERGYPLIPDLTSYQEAIYWYVVMKLTFPKFMSGKLTTSSSKYSQKYAQQTYFYTQQQWNFYRNQAYAEAMMPTADDMQNIKNDWNKLIPDWDGDDTFFKNINKEQLTYNDYYYGY